MRKIITGENLEPCLYSLIGTQPTTDPIVKIYKKTLGLLILSTLFQLCPAFAQELEPKTYTNAPVDLQVLAYGFGYTEGAVLPDASIPIENAFIRTEASILAFVKPINVWGRSGRLGMVLPYATVDATGDLNGESLRRKVSGIGDPVFRFQVNFLGARSLKLKEYSKYKQDTIFGFSLVVSAPWGQYDSDKIINVGTNRWMVKPELGFSKAMGKWVWEAAFSAKIYQNNNNFNGGKIRKQETIFGTQSHISYYFNRSTWLSVGGTYYNGGRTTVDGVQQNNLQSNSRFGATFSFNVSKSIAIQIYGNTGTSTRYGSDFNTLGVVFKYTKFPARVKRTVKIEK